MSKSSIFGFNFIPLSYGFVCEFLMKMEYFFMHWLANCTYIRCTYIVLTQLGWVISRLCSCLVHNFCTSRSKAWSDALLCYCRAQIIRNDT